MKIFIDDLREPPGEDWLVFRTAEDFLIWFVWWLNLKGPVDIEEIALDHDLGEEGMTGHKLMLQLIKELMAGRFQQICNIRFTTHSANPVGRKNIEADITELKKLCKERGRG